MPSGLTHDQHTLTGVCQAPLWLCLTPVWCMPASLCLCCHSSENPPQAGSSGSSIHHHSKKQGQRFFTYMSWARGHKVLGEQSPILGSHEAELRDQARKKRSWQLTVYRERGWGSFQRPGQRSSRKAGPILLGQELPVSFYLWPVVWATWVWCRTSNCVKGD